MNGGVGVQGTDEDLDLRVDTLLLLRRLAHDREGTNTLTVETHVLRKRLAKDELVAFLNEKADRVGILVGVAGSEALVGHVEEGEVALFLDHRGDLLPLLGGRVDTGRVVRAGVQEHDAVVRSSLEIGDHAIEVKTDGLLVVVLVLLDLETGVGEDSLVVGPAGVGDVDRLAVGVEAFEEGTANAKSTRTGDRLSDSNAVLLDRSGVGAVGKLSSRLDEVRDTGDACGYESALCEETVRILKLTSVLLVHLLAHHL